MKQTKTKCTYNIIANLLDLVHCCPFSDEIDWACLQQRCAWKVCLKEFFQSNVTPPAMLWCLLHFSHRNYCCKRPCSRASGHTIIRPLASLTVCSFNWSAHPTSKGQTSLDHTNVYEVIFTSCQPFGVIFLLNLDPVIPITIPFLISFFFPSMKAIKHTTLPQSICIIQNSI